MNELNGSVEYSLDFPLPADSILDIAENSTHSDDERLRVIGQAVLDFTAIANLTKDDFLQGNAIDLAPYLDFWFSDAIDIAKASLNDPDSNLRTLAQCLIDQEKCAIESKVFVLRESKRISESRKSNNA